MNPISTVSSFPGEFRRFLVSLLSLSLTLTCAWAQSGTGSLSGKITDAAKGAPLAGAIISIDDLFRESSTDREGVFFIGNLPAGEYTVRVSYLGLDAKNFPVTVTPGERAELSAQLGDKVFELEKITVEGQRAGQARALNQQRSSANLKEIVASDAIGRFPDQNTSEAMQRLSGVALERDQGEGRFISIRGLSADLNNTQIDGINVPSSERATRKVNLDTIPVEGLDGIELTKAVTPDMDADAIGGSVNLKTKTAFSQPGRVLSFAAEGQYNKFRDKWGHKFAGTAGGKFGGDRWGLLVTVSDQKRFMTSIDNEQATGWATKNGFFVPNGNIDIREYHISRIRKGASISLDFRPSTDDELFVRASYNHFSDTENRFRMLFAAQTSSATPTNNEQGTVVNRTITVDLKDRTEDTNIQVISTGGKHQRGNLHIDWLAAYSHSNLEDPFRFEPAFRSGNTTFAYDMSNQEQPMLSGIYQNLALTTYRMNAVRLRHAFSDDRERTLAINLRRDVEWGSHPGYWKVGAKYRLREKKNDTQDNRYTDGSAGAFTLANANRPSTFNPGSTPFLTLDPKAFAAYFAANPGSFIRNNITSSIGDVSEDYTTDENVLAGYAMGSITMDKFTVLAGVRAEQTEFHTKGWRTQGEANPVFSRASAGRNYTDILPSVHAVYKFSPSLQGRVSVGQTLSRPNFADSAFRVTVGDDGNISQGNTQLKPYHSDNFDATLEYYPGKSLGVLSVGFFAKRIEDFIFAQTLTRGAPNGINDLTTPLNGKQANIRGTEFTYQQQLTFLPPPFDGLGFFANYTVTSGDADLGDARPGEKMPFLQQSKRIANLALSYEKHGFLLRVSLNHRSSYLDTIGSGPSTDLFVDTHTQFDLTSNYKITRNLTVFAEVLNLTDEPYRSYYGVSFRNRKTEYYRWSANTGVRFNF